MSKQISLRISDDADLEIEQMAKREARTKSQIMQLAIDHYRYLYRVTGGLALDHIEDDDG